MQPNRGLKLFIYFNVFTYSSRNNSNLLLVVSSIVMVMEGELWLAIGNASKDMMSRYLKKLILDLVRCVLVLFPLSQSFTMPSSSRNYINFPSSKC